MAFKAPEYQRFTGELGKHPVWWPVCKASITRGWKVTWVRRICLGSLVSAFGLTLMFYLLYKVIPGWRELLEQFGRMVDPNQEMPFTIDARFYGGLLNMFIYPVLLPLSVLFGQDLIAADMRTRALEAYFARPLSPFSYLLGRTLAFVAILLGATLIPLMWVWGFDVLTAPSGHYEEVKIVPKAMIFSFGWISLVLALAVQAISSVSKSAIWTSLSLGVIFVISAPIAHILHEITGNSSFLAISLPESIPVIVRDALELEQRTGGHQPTPEQASLIYMVIALISILVLWRRVLRKGLVG